MASQIAAGVGCFEQPEQVGVGATLRRKKTEAHCHTLKPQKNTRTSASEFQMKANRK